MKTTPCYEFGRVRYSVEYGVRRRDLRYVFFGGLTVGRVKAEVGNVKFDFWLKAKLRKRGVGVVIGLELEG